MLRLFSKYVSVGVLNTAIHWIVFGACWSMGASQSIANLIAFVIAVTFSFCVNARYTFGSRNARTLHPLCRLHGCHGCCGWSDE